MAPRRTLTESADAMAWFYRVVEHDDSTWQCVHGTVIDIHETFESALDHINELAARDRPSRVFIHRLNEPVVVAEAFD